MSDVEKQELPRNNAKSTKLFCCPLKPLKYYSESELQIITAGWRSTIGTGAHGKVYLGWIRSLSHSESGRSPHEEHQQNVAVKVFSTSAEQKYKDTQSNEKVMGMALDHPYLVQLLGYCDSPFSLVYEFMGGGDLRQVLQSQEKLAKLHLGQRVTLLYHVALALEFLHHHHQPPILHWDIKPSNILLDSTLSTAKLSDFGLARQQKQDASLETSSSGLRGTLAYLCPVYLQTMKYTPSSDVYSYGIVLLQLCLGEAEGHRAVVLAQQSSDQALQNLVDRKFMPGEVPCKALDELLQLGRACISLIQDTRPSFGGSNHSGTVVNCLKAWLEHWGDSPSSYTPRVLRQTSQNKSEDGQESCREEVINMWEPVPGLTIAAAPGMPSSPVRAKPNDVLLRVVHRKDVRRHVQAGRWGLIDLEEVAVWRMPLSAMVGHVLKNANLEWGWGYSKAIFCAWNKRPDGSVRPSQPWRTISEDDSTPLNIWLDSWMHDAPLMSLAPLITLSFWGDSEDLSGKWVFFKIYLPRQAIMESKWLLFEDDQGPGYMLRWLRQYVGMPRHGPPEDLKIWLESGPQSAARLVPLALDWKVSQWIALGITQGDILVVQEHPDLLPDNLAGPRSADLWLQQQNEEMATGNAIDELQRYRSLSLDNNNGNLLGDIFFVIAAYMLSRVRFRPFVKFVGKSMRGVKAPVGLENLFRCLARYTTLEDRNDLSGQGAFKRIQMAFDEHYIHMRQTIHGWLRNNEGAELVDRIRATVQVLFHQGSEAQTSGAKQSYNFFWTASALSALQIGLVKISFGSATVSWEDVVQLPVEVYQLAGQCGVGDGPKDSYLLKQWEACAVRDMPHLREVDRQPSPNIAVAKAIVQTVAACIVAVERLVRPQSPAANKPLVTFPPKSLGDFEVGVHCSTALQVFVKTSQATHVFSLPRSPEVYVQLSELVTFAYECCRSLLGSFRLASSIVYELCNSPYLGQLTCVGQHRGVFSGKYGGAGWHRSNLIKVVPQIPEHVEWVCLEVDIPILHILACQKSITTEQLLGTENQSGKLVTNFDRGTSDTHCFYPKGLLYSKAYHSLVEAVEKKGLKAVRGVAANARYMVAFGGLP